MYPHAFLPVTLPDEPAEYIRQKIEELAMLGIRADTHMFNKEAIGYFDWLGTPDAILKKIVRDKLCSGEVVNHHNCNGYFELAMRFGTERQKEFFSREMMRHDPPGRKYPLEGRLDFPIKPIIDKREAIGRHMEVFSEKFHIKPAGGFSVLQINAAMEIMKMDYDLIIGVMDSGRRIPMLLDAMGCRVRYLEWRKDWKGKPKWLRIGRNHSRVKKVQNILVCENDAYTGATLKALEDPLRELKPRRVDICTYVAVFCDGPAHLKACVEELHFYDRHLDLSVYGGPLDENNFYTNLKEALKKLQSMGDLKPDSPRP